MPTQTNVNDILKGESQFIAGDYRAALTTFVDVLKSEPDNVAALNDAGLAAAEMGETITAVELFEKALVLDAGNQIAFFNLIDLLIREDAADLALEVFATHFQSMQYSEELRDYANVLMAAGSKEALTSAGEADSLSGENEKPAATGK